MRFMLGLERWVAFIIPGTVLDAGEISVHKTVMIPALIEAQVWWQVQNKNKITQESGGGHSRQRKP